jgi:hypothetical protein
MIDQTLCKADNVQVEFRQVCQHDPLPSRRVGTVDPANTGKKNVLSLDVEMSSRKTGKATACPSKALALIRIKRKV